MRFINSLLNRIGPSKRKKESPPQLIMWYLQAESPDGEEVAGCQVRDYRPGDEEGWLALLQANGELGVWDRERIDGVLAATHVQLFVEYGEQIVACTGVNDRVRDVGACWEIGWVAVHPAFQGRGIAKLITGAAVARAAELGSRPIYLLTDDFRVPALRCYLKLGFVPDGSHPSYPGRWREIFAGLGVDYQRSIPEFVAPGGKL